jgi:hypothetical protein
MTVYRPTPVTEIKAQMIEERIRRAVLFTRKGNHTILPAISDTGLVAGEGRREAMRRAICSLERLRRQKQQQRLGKPLASAFTSDALVNDNEIDVMEY